nr:MAG TPA: Protein of unknown function (DUF1492) [Caudoviricetes sp.]
MSIKEELQELRHQHYYISTRKKEIELLKQDLIFIRGIDYTKDKTGTVQTTQEDLICNILEFETDIMHKMKELLKEQAKVKSKIFALKNKAQQIVLYKRYILCEDWESIADEMGYSLSHIYKLHGWALKELSKLYKC